MLRRWLPPPESELQISDFLARTGGLFNFTISRAGSRDRRFFGSFHEVAEFPGPPYDARIVRTVESGENSGHPYLEELRFTNLAEGRSRLDILSLFASAGDRDAAEAAGGPQEEYVRLEELLASGDWDGTRIYGERSNHRPGEPLRAWDAGTAFGDLALVIKGSASGEAMVRLINGEPLSAEDLIAFGRLNSLCVLNWFEPLVMLLGPKAPQLAPGHAELVREYTKLFR